MKTNKIGTKYPKSISGGSGLPEPENPTGFEPFLANPINPNPMFYQIDQTR